MLRAWQLLTAVPQVVTFYGDGHLRITPAGDPYGRHAWNTWSAALKDKEKANSDSGGAAGAALTMAAMFKTSLHNPPPKRARTTGPPAPPNPPKKSRKGKSPSQKQAESQALFKASVDHGAVGSITPLTDAELQDEDAAADAEHVLLEASDDDDDHITVQGLVEAKAHEADPEEDTE